MAKLLLLIMLLLSASWPAAAAESVGTTFAGMPLSGSWPGFSGTAAMSCPSGSFVAGIQGFKSDRLGSHVVDHPISELRYVCRGTDASTLGVGKTYAGIPDTGSFPEFSGTGMVVCPLGSFVIGIQGFKSDLLGSHVPEHPISELRYVCGDRTGKVIGVGKTYDGLPDTGSFPGFSGTGMTTCPAGLFVVGIQGFKPGESSDVHRPIAELRYTCSDAGISTASTAPAAANPVGWQVRAVAGMTPELAIELARQGRPSFFTTPDASTSLREAMFEVCGEQEPVVQAALEADAASLNLVDDLDQPLSANVTVAVPFCLPLQRNVEVTVGQDDTVELLLKQNYGVFGPRTVERTFELNREAFTGQTVKSFTTKLPIGATIQLPFAAPTRVFTPKDSSAQLPALVEELASPGVAGTLRPSLAETFEDVNEPFEFDLVDAVEVQSGGGSACPADEVMGAPFDLTKIYAVFAEEVSRATAAGFDPDDVVVGIIDTGLSSPEDDFFVRSVLAINPDEAAADARRDVDDNEDQASGAIDDVFGINFSQIPPRGTIEPFPAADQRWRFHGTRMASLILGGPEVISKWPGARRPPLHLKVVNFASGAVGGGMEDYERLTTAIDYLDESDAVVINMSLANRFNFRVVSQRIAQRDDVLFVVAAGNSKAGPGRNLSGNFVMFPARYGGKVGDNKRNLITVAAHGQSGLKAKFSYFSSEFVDLLAPGCGVNTRSEGGAVVPDDGTSPAAAIVSFAAGLLAALDLGNAETIKTRLLLSVDFDDRLGFAAVSSGRLDIPKALAISRDVVETTDGQLHFGPVDRAGLLALCAAEDVDLPTVNQLRKVVTNIAPAGDSRLFVEFWSTPDGVLNRSARCLQADAGGFVTQAGAEPIPLAEVRDITFKAR